MDGQIPRDVRRRVQMLQQEPELSVEVLEELAGDRELRVRFWLARRPELSSGLVALLRDDPAVSVRASLLMNPAVELERPASELADSDEVVVRRSIARRPGIAERVLVTLAEDDDLVVRGFVARHEQLSDELAMRLVDDDWSVRANLVAHLGRWRWLDERLESDSDPCVARLVAVAKERNAE